jgi:hypothetical protein
MANVIRVTGLRELDRAFGKANRALSNDLKDALAEAAAPVRSDAQILAAASIRNVGQGDPWSRMLVGVRSWVAYVAPVERGVKGRGNARRRRPRFGDLLLGRAMEPALERNIGNVERRFEGLIDEVCDAWERG